MNIDTVTGLGTILGIWAHPDDETFMVGGLLSMAVANGQRVICVTATDGSAGSQDESRWPAATIGRTRREELDTALNILGITEHKVLDYQDGNCADVDTDEVCERLAKLIDTYKPDTVITFPPDGVTGHPDHRALSDWAVQAVAMSETKPTIYFATQTQESYDSFWNVVDQKFNVYFATDNPVFIPKDSCDIHLYLEQDVIKRKIKALQAMPSQFEAWFEYLGEHGMTATFGSEALVLASRWAYPSA